MSANTVIPIDPARVRAAADEADAARLRQLIDLSEDGIALEFARRHAQQLRYCHSTGAWFEWTGAYWRKDETDRAFSWARDLCRELNTQGLAKLKKISTASAVEKATRADQRLAVTASAWDRDHWLLGTPGGVVDLRSGELRPASPQDFITKQTAVTPGDCSEPELWLKFLREATQSDDKLIRFLQQIAGYALTGDTREHALFYVYGPGGNGKGVFERTIKCVMADYAITTPMDMFMESYGDRHPTELAMLRGARLVTAEETEQGRAFSQSRIKWLTGGDPVTARFMRQDFFTFEPTWKLLMVGNHQPILRNVDDATRRRFNVIPFTFRPQSPDRTLEERLHVEWPAILRWMIEGCLDWHRNGLQRPAVVDTATKDYFDTQDLLTQWIDECCELAGTFADSNARLFKSWSAFAEAHGLHAGKSQTLSDELAKRPELKRIKDTLGIRGRGFEGIRVRATPATPHWSEDRE
jgi:putative DNA primase/helicase